MRKSEEWLVIINPNAGRRRGLRDWSQIAGWLNHFKFNYHPVFTEFPMHAIDLSKDHIEKGYTRIIVVGGDGTMNEVVNGIFQQQRFKTTEISLGMITVGTGNDWGRMFGIPKDYKEAIQVLLQNKTFIQDAGMVEYKRNNASENRYFVNIAGLGFDAEVVRKTNRLKEKGKGGPLLYLINIFSSLVNYKFVNAVISVDGRDMENEILSINVGICKYNGGGMITVPGAIPDDGLFDLTVINRMSKPNILLSLRRLYDGTINKHPKVDSFTGKSIRVESDDRIMLETDGESLGHTPLEFSIIPKSVKIITGLLQN
ncbi:MAG: diacylglycerol kinase family protein [Bacteroidales bacterium]